MREAMGLFAYEMHVFTSITFDLAYKWNKGVVS